MADHLLGDNLPELFDRSIEAVRIYNHTRRTGLQWPFAARAAHRSRRPAFKPGYQTDWEYRCKADRLPQRTGAQGFVRILCHTSMRHIILRAFSAAMPMQRRTSFKTHFSEPIEGMTGTGEAVRGLGFLRLCATAITTG